MLDPPIRSVAPKLLVHKSLNALEKDDIDFKCIRKNRTIALSIWNIANKLCQPLVTNVRKCVQYIPSIHHISPWQTPPH